MLDQLSSGEKSSNDQDAAKWMIDYLAKNYREVFRAVAKDRGCVTTPEDHETMSATNVAAMWALSGVNTRQQRIIARCLKGSYGRPMIGTQESVKEFGKGAFKAEHGSLRDENGKKVCFWYKEVDKLLEHEVRDLLMQREDAEEFVKSLKSVDVLTGGDHGKGKFRMIATIVMRSSDPSKTFSRRFVCGVIDCNKETPDILKRSFIKKQNDALKRIVHGGRFAVSESEDGMYNIKFQPPAEQMPSTLLLLINLSCEVFVCGDLAFFHLILGRNNMATHWCMWCTLRPKEWKTRGPIDTELWSLEKMRKQHAMSLKGAEGLGMIKDPIWDFVEPWHYIFPVLHIERGLINDVVDFL